MRHEIVLHFLFLHHQIKDNETHLQAVEPLIAFPFFKDCVFYDFFLFLLQFFFYFNKIYIKLKTLSVIKFCLSFLN